MAIIISPTDIFSGTEPALGYDINYEYLGVNIEVLVTVLKGNSCYIAFSFNTDITLELDNYYFNESINEIFKDSVLRSELMDMIKHMYMNYPSFVEAHSNFDEEYLNLEDLTYSLLDVLDKYYLEDKEL